MKMPTKDPNFWAAVIDFYNTTVTPEMRASVMALIISFLRIVYDRKEARWQRILLESLLCGALAYGFSSGLTFFQLDPGLSVFCGAAIGFFGVEFVRNRAQRLIDKRAGIENK
jgi:lambda family phage holin